MDLLEYEGKQLFEQYGLSVPDRIRYTGEAVTLPAGDRLVVKAQVPAGKRKQHGGIKIVDRENAVKAAENMLGSRVAGETVSAVLIESFVDIRKEYYISLSIDRAEKQYTCIFSREGGSGIESVADADPDAVDRFSGYTQDQLLQQARTHGIPEQMQQVLEHMYRLMREEDALLVEINPLVTTSTGVVAADAKVRIDDNALFRHEHEEQERDGTVLEQEAAEKGLEFVELDGNIGVVGNGAGLVMATLDSIHHFQGEPANFLDIGGGADTETMHTALDITTRQNLSGLFINVFGGITRCDAVAQGIIDFMEEHERDLPLVVRLVGTNQEKGRELLETAGIHALESMDACAKKIVELGDAA